MQPKSPNPNYDFIMSGGSKPKKKLLPNLGLPQPVIIGVGLMLVLIIVLIIYGLMAGGNGKNGTSITGLMARAQEISRASSLISQDSQDPNLQALATTVDTSLASEEKELGSYLSAEGQTVDAKSLLVDQNPNTDGQFQTAVQNDNLTSVYNSYLSSNLSTYKNELSAEYSKASGSQLKSILSNAYDSVQTILSSLSSN